MHHQGTRTRTRIGLFSGRRRVLQLAAATVVAAVIAAMTVVPAQAATGDVSEGEGLLLSGSGLVNVDTLAELQSAYSSSTSSSSLGAVSHPLDVSALNAVNVNLGNGIRLLGTNGLLTLGVGDQYASTSTTGSTASSGVLTPDGAIAVGSGHGSTLNLEPLFTQVGANSSLASAAQLNIGALASSIQSTRGATATAPTTNYQIAGANVAVTSPAIAGLNSSLQTTVNTTGSALNNLVASQGFLNSLTTSTTSSLTSAIRTLIPLANLSGTTVTASINGLNLGAVTAPVLTQNYTSGPVTINPQAGTISIDLATLQALNNQPANTKLLSTQALQDTVTGAIKDILTTQIPAALNTAIVGALGNATLKVSVNANASLVLLGTTTNVATVSLTSTVPLSNLVSGGTSVAPTVTANVSAINNLVTIPADAVGPALAPVVSSITGSLGTLLSPTLNGLAPALLTVLNAANVVVAPLIGIINQVVSITVNAQDSTSGFRDSRGNDTGARSVHALQLTLLPVLNAATVNLATSTVNVTTIAPVAITSPTANQQFTVATSTAVRSIPVSGTGEPGATIAVDLGAGRTGSATVATDGTWSTSIAGVGVGSVTATATQTFGGVAGTPVSQTFSVVAQQPLTITAPTASQQFLVVSPTATRSITVSGTSTPGATIALDLGSGLTASTTADAQGAWSTPVAGVGVGSYTISATQTSGGVTSAAVTRPFTVVSGAGLTVTAPTANTQYVVPGATSTTTVTVTGTAQPGAIVTAALGGGITGSATAAADGSYSIPVANVGTGSYTVSVTQTVGGVASAAITRPITVVAASPVVIQAPVAGGTFTVAGPLSTTPVTVSGTAQAGATVQVQLASGVSATVTADLNGTWSAPFSNVGVGDYTASVTQTIAGVTSTPVTRSFSVVAGAAVTITSPAQGSVTTVADPTSTIPVTVTGTAQPGASVAVALGSQGTKTVTATGTGSWSAPFTNVPVGGYTISAAQTIGATTSTPVTSTYSIVAGAPVSVTAPASGATIPVADGTSTANVAVTGTAQPAATVKVDLGGGITGTTTAAADGSWTVPLAGVPIGAYTVSTTETIGGTTSPAVTQPLTVAAGAPVVIQTPTPNGSITVFGAALATVPVSGTAQPGATVTASLGTGLTATAMAGPNGSWSTSIANVPAGSYTLSASQTINGGTSAPVTQPFSVLSSTGIVIQTPVSGTTYVVADANGTHTTTVTGVGTPSVDTTVDLGGANVQTVPTTASGTWTATFTALPVANYTVNASQIVGTDTISAAPTTFRITAGAPVTITAPVAPDNSFTVAAAGSTLPVTISGTAQPGASLSVTVAPGGTPIPATADASGAWSVTTPALGVHSGYTATVTQTVNGTTSAGVSTTFSIVKGADFGLTTPIDGANLTVADASGTQDVAVSGTGDPGASVAVTTGTGANAVTQTTAVDLTGHWSTTFLALGVGDHSFSAVETLDSGSTAVAPTVTVHILTAAPATITAPTAGQRIPLASSAGGTTVTVTGTAPDATSVTVSLGGTRTQTVPVTAGTWTADFDALPVGSYTAAVTQTVNGTTSAPVTRSFQVVAGDPVVVTTPVDGSTVTVATADSTAPITVSGTAQAGATVDVKLGTLTGSATVAADGTFSVPFAAVPVSADPYTVSVSQTINGTTSTPVTSTVSVIAGAPLVITTPTQGQTITLADPSSKTDVVVAGTGQPGATIALTVNGTPVAPITVRNSGSWTTTLANTTPGSYVLHATQTVGTTTTPEVDRDFSVVGSAAVTITAPTGGSTVVVPTATSTTPIDVTGVAAPGASVTATTDGGLAATGTADPTTGAYTVTIADVPVGPQTVSVTQTINGTVSPVPTTVDFTVAAAADLTITSPADGTAFTVPTAAGTTDITLSGKAQADAPIAVSLGTGLTATTTATDAGTWTATVKGVPVGSYTASVTQTIAGTVSAPVTEKLTVAVAAPVVITAPVNDQSFPIATATDTVTVPVSGTAAPGATVSVSLDGGTAKPVTADPTTGAWSTSFADVAKGPHEVSVTEETSAGPTTPALADFTVDVAPAAVITSPVAGQSIQVPTATSTTEVPVSGTGLAGSGISVTLDGTGTPQTTTVSSTGTWDVTFSGVAVGPHEIAATQTVNGTDQDPVTRDFSVDQAAAPAAPVVITSPVAGAVIADTDGNGVVTVPVSGTGQAGSTETVSLSDGQSKTVTVGDDGKWNTSFTGVPVGIITIDVRQTTGTTTTGSDQVGITAETVAAATITAPVAGVPVIVSNATAAADVLVSGTGQAGADIAVDIDGLAGTATVGDDGTWSTTVPAVPVGDHTISVVETTHDVALPAVTQDLVVKAGQGVAVTSPADGSSVTVPTSGSTATLPVTGTADPGATVSVTLDGGAAKSVNAANDGTWSVTFTGVAVGTHTIAASETLADGPTTPVTSSVTVKVAALAVITTPQNDQQIEVTPGSTTAVVVSGTGEPGASISVSLDGKGTVTVPVSAQGSWTTAFTQVGVGSHTAKAVQTVLGVTQSPVTTGFTVAATTTPVVAPTIQSPSAGQIVLDPNGDGFFDVPVSGTGDPGSTITVDLGAGITRTVPVGDDGTWNVTVTNVPDGTRTVLVTQTTDGTTTGSASVQITGAAIDPITVTSPTPGQVVQGSMVGGTVVTVTGTAEPGATVTVSLDGGTAKTTTADGTGAWSVPLTGVSTGSHSIAVSEKLGAATSAPVTVAFSVAAAPAAGGITVLSPAPNALFQDTGGNGTEAVTISGTATPGALVSVSLDKGATTLATAADGTTGAWSIVFPAVADGTHSFVATQTVLGTPTSAPEQSFAVTPRAPLTIGTPAPGSAFQAGADGTASVEVSGTGEPGATVTIVLDGGTPLTTTVGDDGTWTETFTGLAPGSHTYVVTQTIDGFTGAPSATTFTVMRAISNPGGGTPGGGTPGGGSTGPGTGGSIGGSGGSVTPAGGSGTGSGSSTATALGEALAYTGSTVFPWAVVGAGLLALGLGMLGASRGLSRIRARKR